MLPSPEQLTNHCVDTRRFKYHLMKEFTRQGVQNKSVQRIRISPKSYGCLAMWAVDLCKDKAGLREVVERVNHSLELCNWTITKAEPCKNYRGHYSSILIHLRYS